MKNTFLKTYDLFNDDPFFAMFDRKSPSLLRSDIKETDKEFIIEVEVPGIKKEDIKISYEDEYIVITASYKKEENVKYVHSERVSFNSLSRTFYVGNINENEIKAKFENGLLLVSYPKETIKEERTKYIEIQ